MDGSKLNEDTLIISKSNITNIQITIDTDLLMNKYQTPCIVHSRPTRIERDFKFIVVSNQNVAGSLESNYLKIQTSVGDVIHVYGTSVYKNTDSAVLIYDISKFSGEDVFGPFKFRKYMEMEENKYGSTHVFPSVSKQKWFWFYETSIRNVGTENLNISFALFIRVKGQVNPVLYGYFYWNPTVIVKD